MVVVVVVVVVGVGMSGGFVLCAVQRSCKTVADPSTIPCSVSGLYHFSLKNRLLTSAAVY